LHSKHLRVHSNTCPRSRAVAPNSMRSTKRTHAEARTILLAASLRLSVRVTVSSFRMPSVICNVENGMGLFQHIHDDANRILAISTLIILSLNISAAVKCATSKFRMILPANGRSIFAPVLKPPTKTSIYQGSPSRTSCPSSTCPRTAQNVKPDTPSTTPMVWDVRMARLLSRNGPILILPPCLHERWALVRDTLHWMTAGVGGIGKKSSDWVSATSVPHRVLVY
jgi:hypothetical protein